MKGFDQGGLGSRGAYLKFLHLGEEKKDCLLESSLSYTVSPRSA